MSDEAPIVGEEPNKNPLGGEFYSVATEATKEAIREHIKTKARNMIEADRDVSQWLDDIAKAEHTRMKAGLEQEAKNL